MPVNNTHADAEKKQRVGRKMMKKFFEVFAAIPLLFPACSVEAANRAAE